jgi:small subunit ribosomal protein S2
MADEITLKTEPTAENPGAGETAVLEKTVEELYPDEDFREMVEAGVFFGRKKSRTNPKMKPAILTNRNGIEIVNLAKTVEALEATLAFVRDTARKGGLLLIVATQPPAESIVKLATEFGYPYVVRRWLGGTLTNFKVIAKRVEQFKKMKADLASGAYEKYTKKERVMIERQITHMDELMGGLESLTAKPDALLVIDTQLHKTAIHEANHLGIPVVAFVNTDSDPSKITYPVPGNNKARSSITWFVGKLKGAIEEGRRLGPPEGAAPPPAAEGGAKAKEAAGGKKK